MRLELMVKFQETRIACIRLKKIVTYGSIRKDVHEGSCETMRTLNSLTTIQVPVIARLVDD